MTEDPSMKDKAAESAEAGKQAASDLASTAASKAQDVAQEAKGQARNVVGEARDQLRSQAGDQTKNAVTNLRALGDELRSMADHSRQNTEQGGIATDLVSQAADRSHGAADWLDGRDPDDILDEVRRFARRRPGAFLLGTLAAGLVAGRLARGVAAVHSDDSDSPSSNGTVGVDVSPYAARDNGFESVPSGGYPNDPYAETYSGAPSIAGSYATDAVDPGRHSTAGDTAAYPGAVGRAEDLR